MGLVSLPVVNSSNQLMQEQRFTTSGTWTAPTNVNKVWVSLVGGGGSGSTHTGGYTAWAGMPGGVLHQQATVVAGTTYTITIGAGGAPSGSNGAATTALGFTGSGGYGGQNENTSFYDRNGNNYGSNLQDRGATSGDSSANSGAGGGAGNYSTAGGAGGSGLVILKWLS